MSQEFDNNKLNVLKSLYVSDFEKIDEELTSKEKIYGSLTCKKINDKGLEEVWNKNCEILSLLVLMMWCFIVSWCAWKT